MPDRAASAGWSCRSPARRCRSRRPASCAVEPLWMRSASWLAASKPSLSTFDEPYEFDVTSIAVPGRQQVAELRREVEREVDVAHRGELRLRRAAEHRARGLAEVGERRRGAVDDRLADDVRRGQRAVAADARVVVAGPRQHLARPEDERRIAACRTRRVPPGRNVCAVRDEREQAAREVGVAVAVHVAVGGRRALRDGLLVGEVVVVVEVDVDRVVDAGGVRVGDEHGRPLAVRREQVVVRMPRHAHGAGLRVRARELVEIASSWRRAPRSSATGRRAWRTAPGRCRDFVAPPGHLTSVVGVYQERPWSTNCGATSHTSVSYGSNAFGQPFQPGSGAFAPTTSATCRAGRGGPSRCRRRGRRR